MHSVLKAGLALFISSLPWLAHAQYVRCDAVLDELTPCFAPDTLPIVRAGSAPGKFAARMIFLADQLERNIDIKLAKSTYMVGSFVDINDMTRTSAMGRLIAENLMHEMQVRSWRIFEPRLMQNFMINESGEFVLSRDVKQLRDKYDVTGVIAGTYSIAGDYTVINARVIQVDTGVVLSSAQIQMPANWFASALMTDVPIRPMKIVGRSQ